MKKLLFALLLICLFCTCKKDPYANLCGGSDPIKNLPWLKAKINEWNKSNAHGSISRLDYRGQTLYFVGLYCCTNCYCLTATPYNCDGNIVTLTSDQYSDISSYSQIHKPQSIWHN